jgi:hypothetical protein
VESFHGEEQRLTLDRHKRHHLHFEELKTIEYGWAKPCRLIEMKCLIDCKFFLRPIHSAGSQVRGADDTSAKFGQRFHFGRVDLSPGFGSIVRDLARVDKNPSTDPGRPGPDFDRFSPRHNQGRPRLFDRKRMRDHGLRHRSSEKV